MVPRGSDLGGLGDFDCLAVLSQIQASPARRHDCNLTRRRLGDSALAGQSAGGREIVARYSPDATNSRTGVDKNGRRRQADKAYQESVFDQVLTLFVLEETTQRTHDSIFAESTIEPQDDIWLWAGFSTVMVPFS